MVEQLESSTWRSHFSHRFRLSILVCVFLLYITLCFTMVDMPEAGTVIVGNVYRFVVIGFLIWVARYAEPLLLRRSSTPRVPAG